MKSVLLPIQPRWCELIASGDKTIEVRKTKPKIDTPFKCYIYETQGATDMPWMDEDGHMIFKGRGQVIGEFVCDKIYYIAYSIYPHDPLVFEELHTLNRPDVLSETCLSNIDICEYLNGENGYGWHISDLKIYDTPKGLDRFTAKSKHGCEYFITRPPQSWCYVERNGVNYNG